MVCSPSQTLKFSLYTLPLRSPKNRPAWRGGFSTNLWILHD